MARRGIIKWDTRPGKASLLRHQGERWVPHANEPNEPIKPHLDGHATESNGKNLNWVHAVPSCFARSCLPVSLYLANCVHEAATGMYSGSRGQCHMAMALTSTFYVTLPLLST